MGGRSETGEHILVCVSPSPDSPKYIQTHIGIGYRMLKVDE